MSNNPSSTGRLFDDEEPELPRRRPAPASQPTGPQSDESPRIGSANPASQVPLRPAQRACYDALGLALQEGHVFAAVTGPEASGKTTVLEAVLADRHDRALRCIRISDPDKVPARLAAQIEQVAYSEALKPENQDRHVVLAIDDAHTASIELLRCLTRLAAMREPGRRVPQILLVGRTELWNRLAAEEYAPLTRRLAIRAALPTLQEDYDPWASLEQEVSQTMSQLRVESERLPTHAHPGKVTPLFDRGFYPATMDEAGLPLDPETLPPPMDYALFPDAPPQAPVQRDPRRRLLLPLGCLMAAIAIFTFVLSFLDWPDLLDDMPWADAKPAQTFTFKPPPNAAAEPRLPPRPQSLAQATPAPALPPRPEPAPAAQTTTQTTTQTTDPAAANPVAINPVSPPPASAPVQAEPPKPVAAIVPAPVAAPPAPAPAPVAVAAAPPPAAEPAATAPAAPAPTAPAPTAPAPAATSTAAELPEPPIPPKPATPPPPTTALASVASPPANNNRRGRAAPIAVVKPAPLPPSIVSLLLRRGEEQLTLGDVSAARLLFERAAESGSAQAAYRLGRTYDSSFLPSGSAAALADRNAARVWYGRAASLGDREATTRLRELNEAR